MGLELFNASFEEKKVPKYKYIGTITLPIGGTYPIEEYMGEFYKPFATVGVLVRATVGTEPIKQTFTKPEFVEINKKEIPDDVELEFSEDFNKDIETENVEVPKKKYTKKYLDTLSLKETRDLVTELGIDKSKLTGDLRSKDTLVKAILDSQK